MMYGQYLNLTGKPKQCLQPVKFKINLQTVGVYHIKCSCGMCYIRESHRLISTRLKEHIRNTKNEDIGVSAVEKTLLWNQTFNKLSGHKGNRFNRLLQT